MSRTRINIHVSLWSFSRVSRNLFTHPPMIAKCKHYEFLYPNSNNSDGWECRGCGKEWLPKEKCKCHCHDRSGFAKKIDENSPVSCKHCVPSLSVEDHDYYTRAEEKEFRKTLIEVLEGMAIDRNKLCNEDNMKFLRSNFL